MDVINLLDKEDCALLIGCSQFLQHLFQGEVAKSASENAHLTQQLVGALGFNTGTALFVGPKASKIGHNMFQAILEFKDFKAGQLRESMIDIDLLIQLENRGLITERMANGPSGRSIYGVNGRRSFKEEKRRRRSTSFGRDQARLPELGPWGQLARLSTNPGLESLEFDHD